MRFFQTLKNWYRWFDLGAVWEKLFDEDEWGYCTVAGGSLLACLGFYLVCSKMLGLGIFIGGAGISLCVLAMTYAIATSGHPL